jgi:tRNA-splicing ligase RtcB (3'-phosphate/5'-hydroxy nucleic acid ligase)
MELTVVTAPQHEERPAAGPRVFDGRELPADPEILGRLGADLRGMDLAAPPVVLPDFHHKSDMEMPSSVAVATRDTVRPTLTSASVNCGMALIALDMDPPSRAAVSAFFDGVRGRYPHPPRWRRELSAADVLRAAVEGAGFAVERYGLDPASLERIEEGGRLDLDRFGGADRLRRDLPWLSVQLARLRFGTVGPSNHFVELQRVEEIFDVDAARRLGLELGQLTLQYHAGGGILTGQVGRIFVRRKKLSKPVRLQMAVQKPLYHLPSARSLAQIRERLRLYFRDGSPAVPRHGPEGMRLMLANTAAMNYGFAFRAATYATLCALAERTFGLRGARLVVDSPHNSIYEEEVDGSTAIVHRHNACRAYPARRMPAGTTFAQTGQAVLVPGLHRTSSYLGVASDGAGTSLYSACHGAGTVIEEFERRGVSRPHPGGHSTLRFRYSDASPTSVAHLDDRGVDWAMGILRSNDLARPVARMRPLAVLH